MGEGGPAPFTAPAATFAGRGGCGGLAGRMLGRMEQTRETGGHIDRGFIWGLMLVLFGVMLLLGRFEAGRALSYWPFLIILLGVVKLVDPPASGRVRRSLRPGAWLVFIGLWGMVSEFGLFGFDYRSSWTLMIVGAGLMMAWRSLEGPDVRAPKAKE
jgi:hypothetical protein